MLRRLLSPRNLLRRVSAPVAGTVQPLPVVVRPVRTRAELDEVVRLRRAAYGHHRAQRGEPMPDEMDTWQHAVVLAAFDKASGRIVASMRAVVGDRGPLELERLRGIDRSELGVPAEAARLAVLPGSASPLAKLALFKACLQIMLARGAGTLLVAARAPIDQDYEWLMFRDLGDEPQWFIPGGDFPDPHRVMKYSFEAGTRPYQHTWHDFYRFCFETEHPDIRPHAPDGINPLALLGPAPAEPAAAQSARPAASAAASAAAGAAAGAAASATSAAGGRELGDLLQPA